MSLRINRRTHTHFSHYDETKEKKRLPFLQIQIDIRHCTIINTNHTHICVIQRFVSFIFYFHRHSSSLCCLFRSFAVLAARQMITCEKCPSIRCLRCRLFQVLTLHLYRVIVTFRILFGYNNTDSNALLFSEISLRFFFAKRNDLIRHLFGCSSMS